MVDFVRLISEVPVLGYGIGYGGNASIILNAEVDGVKPGWLVEADLSRQMVDLGPIFGMGYIVFRMAFVVWLGITVVKATRRSADPLPLLLYAYAGVTLFAGQITGNGSINAYAWLFAGLCIAAARTDVRSARQLVLQPATRGTRPLGVRHASAASRGR
jgi:hypothetical protein